MKRIFMLLTLILALMCPALAGASEISSDKMILDWTTSKVWVNGGELCVTGTQIKMASRSSLPADR